MVRQPSALSRFTGEVPTAGVYRQSMQVVAIFSVAVYLINLAYMFDGVGTPMNRMAFVSQFMLRISKPGQINHEFLKNRIAYICLPLPKQFMLGLDCQIRDFEQYPRSAHLGSQSRVGGGWWYFYLYGLAVKIPCALLVLLVAILAKRLLSKSASVITFDEAILLVPAALILCIASSLTQVNNHLRYVFPVIGFGMVYVGQSAVFFASKSSVTRLTALAIFSACVLPALSAFPHHLAYFNCFGNYLAAHGPPLVESSLDWGQDYLYLKLYVEKHPENAPYFVRPFAAYDVRAIGLAANLVVPEEQSYLLAERTTGRSLPTTILLNRCDLHLAAVGKLAVVQQGETSWITPTWGSLRLRVPIGFQSN